MQTQRIILPGIQTIRVGPYWRTLQKKLQQADELVPYADRFFALWVVDVSENASLMAQSQKWKEARLLQPIDSFVHPERFENPKYMGGMRL